MVRPAAATLTVTETKDSDDGTCDAHCSLREAIAEASSGDSIEVPAGTYTLTLRFELTIDKSLTITGAGSGDTIIQAAPQLKVAEFRVFNITGANVAISGATVRHGDFKIVSSGGGGAIANSGTLTLADSTISSSYASSFIGDVGGGGVYNTGTLRVINSTISGNVAKLGGGVFNTKDGTVLLENSTVRDNFTSNREGGRIYNDDGTLTVNNSIVTGNGCRTDGGGIYNSGTFTLTKSTVTGNGCGTNGGGIYSSGTLTLTKSTVTDNRARLDGGGIYNSGGSITLTNSTLSKNSAGDSSGGGGGIYNNEGTVTVTNGTVSHNVAHGSLSGGGGIYNNEGTVTLTKSTIIGNTAKSYGGGVRNSGTLHLSSSTVSGNRTTLEPGGNPIPRGGGIYNESSGTVTIINSTVSGNTAYDQGGGIYNENTLTVTYSTISGNEAAGGGGLFGIGGGIANFGTAELSSTLISDNSPRDCSRPGTSLGHNLDSDNTCAITHSDDLPKVDPLLGPLQDNGGPTFTHALSFDSPAINAGDDSACPETDQRGAARPHGPGCDIGAYEFGSLAIDTTPVAMDVVTTTDQDTPVVITLMASDAEECELNFSIVDGPFGGNLSEITDIPCTRGSPNVDKARITFTPKPGFSQADTFTFKVSDGRVESYLATVLVTVIPKGPANLIVTKTQDTNDGSCSFADCSLREAIAEASSGDSIAVPAGTYTLTLGFQLFIGRSLAVQGAGSGDTIIQASAAPPDQAGGAGHRVLTINNSASVSISLMTLRHGFGQQDAGGVLNNGTLVLTSVSISRNRARETLNNSGGLWHSRVKESRG